MTKTRTNIITLKAIALVLVTAIIAYTLVCLLTGNITPLSRVTAMLSPLWLVAELNLLCTLL